MLERSGDTLKTFMLKNTSRRNMQFFLELKGQAVYISQVQSEEAAAAQTTAPEDNGSVTDPDFIQPIEPRYCLPRLGKVAAKQTDEELTDFADQLGLEVVIPSFIISELTRAFQMGFMLFIPFLVIDIVGSSTLMAMGMMMLPPVQISMPFKLILFVLVDGWGLLTQQLFNSVIN